LHSFLSYSESYNASITEFLVFLVCSVLSQKQEEEDRAVAELLPELERLKASILESKGNEGPLDQRRMELSEAKKVLTEQQVSLYFNFSFHMHTYITA
jgi:hypothetical protein